MARDITSGAATADPASDTDADASICVCMGNLPVKEAELRYVRKPGGDLGRGIGRALH